MVCDLIVSKVDQARLLLAEARDAAQAKQVADLARAAEVYARRQQLSQEAIDYATAVKIDAMTLMGQFLQTAPKNTGTAGKLGAGPGRGHKGGNGSHPPEPTFSKTPTLADLGITKKESAAAQSLANLKETQPVLHEQVRNGETTIPKATAQAKAAANAAERAQRAPQAASGSQSQCRWEFRVGTCESLPYADDTFDLVFTSPPYSAQRSYEELEFSLTGEAWVEWATRCFLECVRVCKGLVAWVVDGFTEDYTYCSTPFLLLADLHRLGVKMRKPVVFQRRGIPGSGGPDWLRNDWELIVCATKHGRLPWSDNTAMGRPPKQDTPRVATNRTRNGKRKAAHYVDPVICNPGNVVSGPVGNGGFGSQHAHQNEAPCPEWLADFFLASFCPPGGRVLDPFSGSGTTIAVAYKRGRNGVGIDLRQSQVDLGERRLRELSGGGGHAG
jgi:16S rRNA G966 N2-methylase RsmD